MSQHIKNVVLVHGAFADGSGWKRVADILKNDGYRVSVAQPPETSYADDQKYTKAAIDAMGGPVVLVGHSYGGSINIDQCCNVWMISGLGDDRSVFAGDLPTSFFSQFPEMKDSPVPQILDDRMIPLLQQIAS